MTRALKLLLLGTGLLLLGVGPAWAAELTTPEDQFRSAYERAVKGDAAGALPLFEELLSRYPDDPSLLYNAGTTALAAGRLGPAVLYLERSLAVEPGREDAQANLARANERQQDRVISAAGGKGARGGAVDEIMGSLSADGLAIALSVFNLLFGLSFLWRRLTRAPRRRFALSLLTALFFLLVLAGGALLAAKVCVYDTQRHAVVLEAEVAVRKGPNANYPEAFKVHEGLKLRLGEAVEDWRQVWLSNGLNGYIPEKVLGTI